MKFSIIKQSASARLGRLQTQNVDIETPVFMPVGTHGAIRGQSFEAIKQLGYSLLLTNTYHLLIRPGVELLNEKNGLNRFTGWNGGFLTDSGGFQIFSLPQKRTINDDGAIFKNYLNGSSLSLTPESCIEAQRTIGSDIMMVLDECVPSTSSREMVIESLRRTHLWAKRTIKIKSPDDVIFGIVQGACFPDLRKESANYITQLPFNGFAIGGLAVGENKEEREDMTSLVSEYLPNDKPRYLMGVGTPLDILEAVRRGIDMFDCILPTSMAGQGVAFTSEGKVDLRKGLYKSDNAPIDPSCGCMTCKTYTREYLHQMVKVYEPLAWSVIGYHNLHFYSQLINQIKDSIRNDSFEAFYNTSKDQLRGNDGVHQTTQPKKVKMPSKGKYEVHLRAGSNFYCIRHKDFDEVMHSAVDPVIESNKLYVEQSDLASRLQNAPSLVVWDVGLGAATNAMAAIRCAEKTAGRGALHLYSFEYDLDALSLSLKNSHFFPHLWHKAPHAIRKDGLWERENITWKLLKGDFLELMQNAPVPDLIFYDPFSSKSESEMWALQTFKKIFDKLQEHPSELYTYSASTSVRTALLCAGFHVARGASTGMKLETTIALTRSAIRPGFDLLGKEWLDKWERSSAKLPLGSTESDLLEISNSLKSQLI